MPSWSMFHLCRIKHLYQVSDSIAICRLCINMVLLGLLFVTSFQPKMKPRGRPRASEAPRMYGAGLSLPQMLKCAWSRGTPATIQIPFQNGDSFEQRLADATRRSKYQHLQPRSKAALTQLFGDDFDVGESPEPHCHQLEKSCISLNFPPHDLVRA